MVFLKPSGLAPNEEVMLTKGTGFARYSKTLCWIVAFIWLALALLSFTSGADNAVINGFLWLAGALAFVISAVALGRNTNSGATQGGEASD